MKYKAKILNTKYKDIYKLTLINENMINIKRADTPCGWSQDLVVNLYDIEANENYLLHIGPSDLEEINIPILFYQKQNTIQSEGIKAYVGMAVIPPRFNSNDFNMKIEHLLNSQYHNLEKIYITIPYQFKRFTEPLNNDVLKKLQQNKKIDIIFTEEDYGPASKFIGPIMYRFDEIKNNLLIILDDDRYYNPYLSNNFISAANQYKNIDYFSTDWQLFFDEPQYLYLLNNYYKPRPSKACLIGAFCGSALRINDRSQQLLEYTIDKLSRVSSCFAHDEGIIYGYLLKHNMDVMMIQQKGCYDTHRETEPYALSKDADYRPYIEKDIILDDKIQKLSSIIYNNIQSNVQQSTQYDCLLFLDIFNDDELLNNLITKYHFNSVYVLGNKIQTPINNLQYINRNIDIVEGPFATNLKNIIYKYNNIFIRCNLGTEVDAKWLLSLGDLSNIETISIRIHHVLHYDNIDLYIFLITQLLQSHALLNIDVIDIAKNNRYNLSQCIELIFNKQLNPPV